MKVTNYRLRRIIREALEDPESTPDMMAEPNERFSAIVDIAHQTLRDVKMANTKNRIGLRELGDSVLALSEEFKLLSSEMDSAYHSGETVFVYMDMLEKLASLKR
jgi:hypothetical protein